MHRLLQKQKLGGLELEGLGVRGWGIVGLGTDFGYLLIPFFS